MTSSKFPLFVAGIFLALSYFLYAQVARNISIVKSHTDIDSKAYLERAHFFYKTNSLARSGEKSAPYFTLGYPLIMGLLFKLFGESKTVVIYFQVLLAILIGLLVFLTTQRLFNTKVAQVTALLCACNLGFLVFAQFILTEICLVFFLALFFERFSYFLSNYAKGQFILSPVEGPDRPSGQSAIVRRATAERHKNIHALITAGLSLGCSVIIKPAALYFPIFLIPIIFWVTSRYSITPSVVSDCVSNRIESTDSTESLPKKLHLSFIFLLSFALPIISYSFHNKYVFGSYKLGSLDQVNIYFWFFPHVLAQENGTNSDIERDYLARLNNHDPLFTPVKKLFWEKFVNNPIKFICVWFKNVFKTCAGLYTTNLKVLVDPDVSGGDISFFRINGTVLQKIHKYITGGTDLLWVKVVGYLEAFWSIFRYFLCLLALLGLVGKRRYQELYFFTSYLFYFSMITGHDGCARFRMLFEFVLIILAAYGLCLILGHINNHVRRRGPNHEGDKSNKNSYSSGLLSYVNPSTGG